MLRKNLDHDLEIIRNDLLILSNIVETAMYASVVAMKEYDLEKSQQVLGGDKDINRKRYQTESEIMSTISTQSPITRDLRFLSSSLIVCSELERVGDYAKTIAKINLRLKEIGPPHLLELVYAMGATAADMLHRAMAAFVLADAGTAKQIITEDDKVDAMYLDLYDKLMRFILHDARNTDHVNSFIWAAHNLERAGDRVTNICERAIYVETGELDIYSASTDGL